MLFESQNRAHNLKGTCLWESVEYYCNFEHGWFVLNFQDDQSLFLIVLSLNLKKFTWNNAC